MGSKAAGRPEADARRSQRPLDKETLERPLVERTHDKTAWPIWFSAAVLAGATAFLIPVTDTLTTSVVAVTGLLGWSQVFVGMIVVANAGNVAEAYATLRLAFQKPGRIKEMERLGERDTGLDLALGIASARPSRSRPSWRLWWFSIASLRTP